MYIWKRVQAFFLAACLTAGLILPAAAAGKSPVVLTDADKIVNKEAVTLMLDLGIVSGKGDGSFGPEEGIDRASMAKMLFNVLGQGLEKDMFFGQENGLKDVRGHWAEGYINYCYSLKIIAGKGGGIFAPDEQVNVVSAAKMLLVALGYDAVNRGYEGTAGWSENIMRDAKTVGLLNGIGQFDFEVLTRDNAAQMIYNALFTSIRKPVYRLAGGDMRIVSYQVLSTTLGLEMFGLVKCTMNIGDVTTKPQNPTIKFVETLPAGKTISGGGVILDPLREGNGNFSIGPELAGSNVALYAKASYTLDDAKEIEKITFQELYSSKMFVKDVARLGRSTSGAAITVLTDSSQSEFISELDKSVLYLLNGVTVDAEKANEAAATRGAVVELLDTDKNQKADIIKITVKNTAVLSGDVETRNYNGVRQVRFPGVPGLTDWTNDYMVSGNLGLKKEDGVLCVKIGDTIYVEESRAIVGNCLKSNSESGETVLKVDGVSYKGSGLTRGAIPGWAGIEGNYVLYLDDNGDIFCAIPAKN